MYVAVDTETNAAPIDDGLVLRLVTLSDGIHTTAFDPVTQRDELVRILSKDLPWVAHNAKFDRDVIKKTLGVDMQIMDTMTRAHLQDSRARHQGGPGLSLADLADHHLGYGKLDEELKAHMRVNKYTWATIPSDDQMYVTYAKVDALLTAWLAHTLPPHQLEVTEARVSRVCSAMERRGFLVDRDRARQLVVELRAEAAKWAARGKELGLPNVNSSQQICKVLGTVDARKETLQLLVAEGNEIAEAILKSKAANKDATTYAAAFLARSEADGRLHTDINPVGTRTGRMSSARPNLQNVPRKRMRDCLIADEGQVVWSVDFKGVEIRVLAALSGDQKLISSIIDGGSLHDETATVIFGPKYTDEQRNLAKVGVFATLYGAGVAALQQQLRVDEDTARAIRGSLFKAFPGVGKFDRKMRTMAERVGYVETWFGRRIIVEPGKSYTGTNYSVQGTAAELFKNSMLQVVDAGLGGHLLVPIHDELVGQAPEAEAPVVMAAVRSAMATKLGTVPIEASGKVGKRSWGSLYV